MKFIVVYKEDYPWDVRVEKIAKAISESGFQTVIIANNESQRIRSERIDSLQIYRLPGFSWLPKRFATVLRYPFWFNPLWLFTIFFVARSSSKTVLIIRDLPLLKAGVLWKALTKGFLVYDMAEVYPNMYESSSQVSTSFSFARLLKSPALAERYEQKNMPTVDSTLVMIEESRDRLIKRGVPPEKITIVSNTPPSDKYGKLKKVHAGGDLRIVYVGFLTRLRGLDLLIQAARQFIDNGHHHSELKIDIIGKGSEKERLIQLCKDLELEDSVKIHGWLPQDQVDELLEKSNVGALTYRVCSHWNTTIPNKIFDYMLAGLPVLATEVVPIKRILEDIDAGLVCADLSYLDIASKLELLQNPKTRQRLGDNGYRAVLNKYNWEQDKARLNATIESFIEQV